jgi:hypothetical protein
MYSIHLKSERETIEAAPVIAFKRRSKGVPLRTSDCCSGEGVESFVLSIAHANTPF